MMHVCVACACDDQVFSKQGTQGHQGPAVQGANWVTDTAYNLFLNADKSLVWQPCYCFVTG